MRKDWVYTPQGYLSGSFSQNSGVATAVAQPLLYATAVERRIAFGDDAVIPAVNNYTRSFAYPEQRPAVVYAVEGHVVYNPSAWAVGNEFAWGWRLIIGKQDPGDLAFDVDVGYSMWVNPAAPSKHIAFWRNTSEVLAEGRWYRSFGENTSNGS